MAAVEVEGRKVAPEINGKFHIGQIFERIITEGSSTFREQCLVIAVRAAGAQTVSTVTSTVRAAKTLQLLTEAQVDWSEEPSGLNWHPVHSFALTESVQTLAESLYQLATEQEDLRSRVVELEAKNAQYLEHVLRVEGGEAKRLETLEDVRDALLKLQGRVDGLSTPASARPAQDPEPILAPSRMAEIPPKSQVTGKGK